MENFVNSKAPTLAKTYNASMSSSVTVTLNSGTTYIEVSAIAKPILLKWGTTASTSAFDECINAGLTRIYVVLTDPATGVRYTTVQFIEQAASAALVVLEK